jgi:hypothetical protein
VGGVVVGVIEALAPVAEVAADHKQVGRIGQIRSQQLAVGSLCKRSGSSSGGSRAGAAG